jgi:hypothetical protein
MFKINKKKLYKTIALYIYIYLILISLHVSDASILFNQKMKLYRH